jgi:hypothetical protein
MITEQSLVMFSWSWAAMLYYALPQSSYWSERRGIWETEMAMANLRDALSIKQ